MIHCQSLGKEFATKDELFKELKANERKIISIKKSQVFKSAEKGQLSINGAFLKDDSVIKSDIGTEKGYVYPVINTTWYLDSHDDVHKSGLWKKTIKENEGKIFYITGHKFDVDNVITWPEDVEVLTKNIPWKSVGKDYEGETEALIFKIKEENIGKESARKAISERRKVQGSVSMMYVKIEMGIDSKEKDYVANKQIFDNNIDLIANKEKAREQGYFFLVSEAKIVKEGSLVLAGSNDATEIIYPKNELTKCEDCGFEFKYDSITESGIGYIKCPNCKVAINQKGKKCQPFENTDTTIEPQTSTQKIDYEFISKNLKLKI